MTLFNFAAGPATLPKRVLKEVQEELLNWQHSNLSILETGHRSSSFKALLEELELGLRRILTIPDSFHVLFINSPARQHFAQIPLNFINNQMQAAYLISGLWSSTAYKEAKRIRACYDIPIISSDGKMIESLSQLNLKPNTAYVYYTPNETVNGIRTVTFPLVAPVPLIADMTSCLLVEPFDLNLFDLIFAGAQKNIANAGLTLVLIKEQFLQQIKEEGLANIFNYQQHALAQSLLATPPTFNCYLASKMIQWIESQGGVESLYRLTLKKSSLLYDYIDSSGFYFCPIDKETRSQINVCFNLPEPKLDSLFLKAAAAEGLIGLEGHRSVGGIRASLYNAMPLEGVKQLLSFMQQFIKHHINGFR